MGISPKFRVLLVPPGRSSTGMPKLSTMKNPKKKKATKKRATTRRKPTK